MLVTLLGMVTEVKPLQPQKASSPMLVTLSLIIAVFIKMRYVFHGTSELEEYDAILPVPLMVSILSTNVHVKLLPHFPEIVSFLKTTETEQVAVLLLLVFAVMVADPALIAVTFPAELTVATDVLLLLHVTVVVALDGDNV